MTAAITAASVAVVGSAILANQSKKAAEGAANAQKKSVDAATDVERERLAQEAQQYQQQMQEYQRKQAMYEKQQQQTMVNLAPYMQAGQGALYEMMALTGMAAPQGAQMPTGQQPVISGLRAGAPAPAGQQQVGAPAPSVGNWITGPVASLTQAPSQQGRMGILGNTGGTVGGMSPAAAEFQKGGLSLSSKRWDMVAPGASPQKEAADMLMQVRAEMPNATAGEQQQEAINRLNAQYGGLQQQAMIDEARAQVPTIEAATSPYAGMTGAEAQQTAIQRVAESPLLQELMAQGETGLLQNAAATGGLRGGRTQAALSQFRPAMLQNEIDKLYSRYQGLSGLGQQSILASPMTAVGATPTYNMDTSQLSNLITQGGAAQAGNLLAQQQYQADMLKNIGTAAGWGIDKYGQKQGWWGS